MLVDPIFISEMSEFDMMLISTLCGAMSSVSNLMPKRLDRGSYLICHFNLDLHLDGSGRRGEGHDCWNRYPHVGDKISENFDLHEYSEYGVCDSPDQFFKNPIGKWISSSDRLFTVSFTKIEKASQAPVGGWRWHKWGEYIGVKSPKCEYIYDEDDDIQEVYCFHIFECLDDSAYYSVNAPALTEFFRPVDSHSAGLDTEAPIGRVKSGK